ncbi:MAG: hypothetical protein QOG10_919 [Kribbellaceae bacterium]|nr:hypothetical protein [Kribbellaceae bacterium]
MKYLYYTSVPWPYLETRFSSFPHTNESVARSKLAELYRETIMLFREAEKAGFDWLGVGEEHMNAYGVVPNPTLFASMLAPITHRAKLAILGNPLPLLNPVRVAEEYAMVDVMSGGRMIAGFPRGVPQNYAAYSIDSTNSRGQLSEAIDLVRKAWSHAGPFSWQGKHYNFDAISIWPQPLQSHPEIVLSCKSVESIQLAVKHRAVMAEIYVRNREVLDSFERGVGMYRDEARAHGWEPEPRHFALSVPCVIAATDREAQERAARALTYQQTRLSGTFDKEKEALADTYYQGALAVSHQAVENLQDRIGFGGIVCGSAATAAQQIDALSRRLDIGVIGLQMHFGDLTASEVLDSIVLFGAKVRKVAGEARP